MLFEYLPRAIAPFTINPTRLLDGLFFICSNITEAPGKFASVRLRLPGNRQEIVMIWSRH